VNEVYGVLYTTNVVSLNPTHGEVYLVQHNARKLSVTFGRLAVFSRYHRDSIELKDMERLITTSAINTETSK
jgi:anthranilate/para-aminobenzoate synthase component II